MIVSGAMISAIWRGTFSLRLPAANTNAAAEMAIAFLGGVILAIGARIAQGCSVGGFWSGLAALSLFGLVFTLGFIPGTIARYYAYVTLSSAAARRVRSVRTTTSVKILAGDRDVSGLIAVVLWSLVLAAVGLEFPAFNALLKARLAPAVASQWSLVLEIMSLLTFIAGVVGWARRK
ncbi:MAG: YeeE/YedE thiosulfate transporter family protein [Acidilobus sp.]